MCAPRQGMCMHADSLPRRRPFQRAGVTDELPPRVGPFALRRLGTMLDRTEAYVLLKTSPIHVARYMHKASADNG